MTVVHPLAVPALSPSLRVQPHPKARFGSLRPAYPAQVPPANGFSAPANWLWIKGWFLLRRQKVGGKPLNKALFRQYQKQVRPLVQSRICQAEQQHWPHVARSEPLRQIGYTYHKGIPPSLVWVQPNPSGGLPIRQNTNGLIARIFIDILADNTALPPAASLEQGVAMLHEVRQGLTDLAMEKALALPGVRARSGGFLRQLWRHWFPELRPRCENIQKPFAYRLQGLAPGIFSVASVSNKLYSMIQIHHLVFVGDNGGILITGSPSYKAMIEMIREDPIAQTAINFKKPLSKEGWGFLPVPLRATRLNLKQTMDLLQQQANKHITWRTQNDWGDIETLLREIPFDLKRHIMEKRLPVLLDKPGADGRSVLSQWPDPV